MQSFLHCVYNVATIMNKSAVSKERFVLAQANNLKRPK